MVRPFQWGILERMTKTDFAVHAKMYGKLQKRVKGCTIPILADKIMDEVELIKKCTIALMNRVIREHYCTM